MENRRDNSTRHTEYGPSRLWLDVPNEYVFENEATGFTKKAATIPIAVYDSDGKLLTIEDIYAQDGILCIDIAAPEV